MNIRKLRNKLPGVDVRREGNIIDRMRKKDKLTFEGDGLKYSILSSDKRGDEEVAALIRSKIPSAAIIPPHA